MRTYILRTRRQKCTTKCLPLHLVLESQGLAGLNKGHLWHQNGEQRFRRLNVGHPLSQILENIKAPDVEVRLLAALALNKTRACEEVLLPR